MKRLILLALALAACTPKPPDVPVCENLQEVITMDPLTGHTMLAPSPACMQNLQESNCEHCVWIVSGDERFIGEERKQIQLQELDDTGKQDAKGNEIYSWKVVLDKTTKNPVMVSSWLNDAKPASQIRRESVQLPAAESYAPLMTYVINACKKMNCGTTITAFKIKLDSLNGIAGSLGI